MNMPTTSGNKYNSKTPIIATAQTVAMNRMRPKYIAARNGMAASSVFLDVHPLTYWTVAPKAPQQRPQPTAEPFVVEPKAFGPPTIAWPPSPDRKKPTQSVGD
jgi:hypothetical protein